MSLSTIDFDFISDLVKQRSAIVLEAGKEYLVESRLAPVAKAEGMADIGALVTELRKPGYGRLHHAVIEAMTTNETFFFRDQHPFDCLRDEVLPTIIANRRPTRTLRIWCAATSSGQEPYTIGMVLREHFPELVDWNVSILATDISLEMLERTKEGRYSQIEVNRGLPATMLVRHFTKEGVSWRVSENLRSLVETRQVNLAQSWGLMPTMDVIFMRNVLIYFDVETKSDILRRCARTLANDGALFLGGAETTLNLCDDFERVATGKATFYRPKA